MDCSRKVSRKEHEITLQHQSQQESLLVEELAAENIAGLQTMIEQLQSTPQGSWLLLRRINSLAPCKRIAGEKASQYYERLRLWLVRELPPTRLPLYPPRQVEQ